MHERSRSQCEHRHCCAINSAACCARIDRASVSVSPSVSGRSVPRFKRATSWITPGWPSSESTVKPHLPPSRFPALLFPTASVVFWPTITVLILQGAMEQGKCRLSAHWWRGLKELGLKYNNSHYCRSVVGSGPLHFLGTLRKSSA